MLTDYKQVIFDDMARSAGQRVTPAAVNTVIPACIMIEGRGERAQTDTTGVPVKPLKTSIPSDSTLLMQPWHFCNKHKIKGVNHLPKYI